MEHTLVSHNNNQPIYSNDINFNSIDYLSLQDVSQIPLHNLIYSYQYVCNAIKTEELNFKIWAFEDSVLTANGLYHRGEFRHTNNDTKFYSSTKFVDRNIMTKLHHDRESYLLKLSMNNKSSRVYKNFSYNDDNFLNLHSTSITNYSPSESCRKFKNSNMYNNERVQYLIWRNWSKQQFGLRNASVQCSRQVLNDQYTQKFQEDEDCEVEQQQQQQQQQMAIPLIDQLHRLKFNQCEDNDFMARYLTLTFADQHDVCYGPLVASKDLSKTHINEKIKYATATDNCKTGSSVEGNCNSNTIPVPKRKVSFVDVDEVVSSAPSSVSSEYSDSIFSCARSINSSLGSASILLEPETDKGFLSAVVDEDGIEAKATLAKSCLKSCMKAKSKNLYYADIENSKQILISYQQELNKNRYFAKHNGAGKSVTTNTEFPVMFSTEACQAKIVELLSDEEIFAKLAKYEQIEKKCNDEFNHLKEYWNGFLHDYEEEKLECMYFMEMNMITQEEFNRAMKHLDDQLQEKRAYSNKQCNLQKVKHNRNRSKINKLRALLSDTSSVDGDAVPVRKMISKLKKVAALKHGHFVEGLEETRIANLRNFIPRRTKLNRNNSKMIVLRNVIDDSDIEEYYQGLFANYNELDEVVCDAMKQDMGLKVYQWDLFWA